MADRYVVLGLAQARSPWSRELARLSTSGALPLEFVPCVSVEELHARLAGSRTFSAVLVDGGLPGLDRDLVDAVGRRGAVVLCVDDPRVRRDWAALGVADVLGPQFGRDELLSALASHARTVRRAELGAVADGDDDLGTGGRLVAVTGPGGTGASTAAAALAQGWAGLGHGRVVLADWRLHAELAVLHGTPDVVPGLPEWVDAHRHGRPAPETLDELVFAVEARGYDLLLGLRRHRDWAALRPRAVRAALDGLLRAAATVVVDVDPDCEGQDETGSVEVEERNVLARTALGAADAVVVVGQAGVKGVHALARTLAGLVGAGVPPDRLVPVVNRGPRSPRERAEVTRALAELTRWSVGRQRDLAPPVFLPDRRSVEAAHRDAERLPSPLPATLVGAVQAVLERAGPARTRGAGAGGAPSPVRPGDLGRWADTG